MKGGLWASCPFPWLRPSRSQSGGCEVQGESFPTGAFLRASLVGKPGTLLAARGRTWRLIRTRGCSLEADLGNLCFQTARDLGVCTLNQPLR